MKMDCELIVVLCAIVLLILYYVILPLFNAYLQYRIQIEEMKMSNQTAIDWNKFEQERLQRNNDDPDIKQRSGKSDEGTPLHDEELPL